MLKNLPFNITHKILLLVAALSSLAILTTLYSLNSMHKVDKNYRVLLENKSQNTLFISEALVDLSDASALAFSVLTEQKEQHMRISQNTLLDLQLRFIDKLTQINSLSEPQTTALTLVKTQQAQVFGLINEVIEQAARWRGDRALIIIHEQLEPELSAIRTTMDELRQSIREDYLGAAQHLAQTTQDTIFNTVLAVSLILLLAIGFTSLVSYTEISRPITRLTRVMSRLSDRHYTDPIDYQQRNDEVGRMAQALHVFRDDMRHAQRLEVEAARSAENQRLSQQLVALTDAMPGAVFQLRVNADRSREFLFLSSKAETFLEQPVESLLNRTFNNRQTIFPGSSTYQWLIDRAFARSQKSLQPIDLDVRVERGQRACWYKILASCTAVDQSATLFNGVLLDVTAAKDQAQALEEAKNSAEQAARTQATFLNTMSHEIRTPMNAIVGLTQLAIRSETHEPQLQRLSKISTASQHLLTIINDILDFSKIDGNHLELEHIAFQPAELIASTVEMLSVDAQNKGLQLHLELDPQLPQFLKGDPTRIGQILMNYLNNAIKFSDSGSIHIRAHLKGTQLTGLQLYCEVQDQGIGIAEHNIKHLFKEFKQADASITRRFGGTGLGLAISSKLAQLMGGEVGVYSKKGHGSTFWFRVAVSPHQARTTAASTVQPATLSTPPAHFKGLRVLLVDDNELNRLVGQTILEEAGFIVELAFDGQQAIDCIARVDSDYYSAVLMDIMMPVLDGFTAAGHIRQLEQGKSLPLIALSANTSTEYSEGYAAAGLDGFLSKPICEQKLWQTLAQHIKQKPSAKVQQHTADRPLVAQHNLSAIQSSMGDARFRAFLIKLSHDYQTRLDSIAQLNNPAANRADIQQNLHDLISTAGHAGFQHLAQLARDLNDALTHQQQQPAQQLHVTILEVLGATIAQLQQQINALHNNTPSSAADTQPSHSV